MNRAVLISVLIGVALQPACVVTPDVVRNETASFDSGAANSGIISLTEDGATVTPKVRARYNALIRVYGTAFLPPLTEDLGLLPGESGTYHMTNEALDYFLVMNRWWKMGRKLP